MPARTLFITATDTGAGKTFITTGLLTALGRARVPARVLKPFATGCRPVQGHLVSEDHEMFAEVLDDAFNGAALSALSLYCYQAPVSPYAAQLAGEEPTTVDWGALEKALKRHQEQEGVLLVEGIGGVATPLCQDKTAADLAVALNCPALVIAPNRLGTLNHTLMSVDWLKQRGVALSGFLFNDATGEGPDESSAQNANILTQLGQLPYLGFVHHGPPLRTYFDELVRRLGLMPG